MQHTVTCALQEGDPDAWGMTPKQLWDRQCAYDELMAHFDARALSPASRGMFALHKRVVRILDGEEPDPRKES